MEEWCPSYGAQIKRQTEKIDFQCTREMSELHSMEQADPFSTLCKYSPCVSYEDLGDLSENITAPSTHTSALFHGCRVLSFVTSAWEGKRHYSATSIWLIKFSHITVECFCF